MIFSLAFPGACTLTYIWSLPRRNMWKVRWCFPSKSVSLYHIWLDDSVKSPFLIYLACSDLKPVGCNGPMVNNTWWCWDIRAGEQWGWYLFVVGAQQMEPFRPGPVEFPYGFGCEDGWGVRMWGIYTDAICQKVAIDSRVWNSIHAIMDLRSWTQASSVMIPMFGKWTISM